MRRKLTLVEACRELHLSRERFLSLVEQEWICPERPEVFDEEDLARARLITELREQLGANDEAIPIILHLIDELHALRRHLRKIAS